MMHDAVRGRRIAVHGAAGFIGSYVTARLLAGGAEVTTLVRNAADPVPAAATVVVGDACDPRVVARAIDGCEIVFAFAGKSGAVASARDPQGSLSGTVGVLQTLLAAAVAAPRAPRIVFPGSRLSYGIVATVPVGEDAPRRPTSPYGLHKTFCEEYLALYRRRHGLRYAVARLTNPYGSCVVREAIPYNVLGAIAARAVAGLPLTVYGDGAQVRDYLAIDDTVDALLLLALAEDDDLVVNIGSGVGVPFVDAVRTIADATGAVVRHEPWPADDRAVETGDFVADIARARALGFTPRIDLAAGLRRLVDALREGTK